MEVLFCLLLSIQYSEDSWRVELKEEVAVEELLTSLVGLEQCHWPSLAPASEQRSS